MRETSIELTTVDGGRFEATGEALRPLRAHLEGELLRAGDAGWTEAVRVWNATITKSPALVVRPRSARDVAAVIDFASDRRLLLSVKCGGHNIAGTSIADRGLMLDMSPMREVAVDPEARLARVGGGCRLRDVDAATQRHGLATTLGFVSETGVAGLTLGGGFGYLMRRFGWAADNLEEVEIVTADGRVRIADRDRDRDLFWAIRGGGGNFGVVTRFTFRVHRVGPIVTGGLMVWSADLAEQVLEAYRSLTSSAPRELTAAAIIRLAPPAPFVPAHAHFKPIVGVLVCHTGADPRRDLEPLRALPPPLVDLVTEHPYTVQQSMLDDLDPAGFNQYWKTEFLPELSSAYLDVWRRAALAVASPMSYSVIFHIGGANNDHDVDDGAVGNRDARFVSGFSGVWRPGEDGRAIVEAVRQGWRQIRPFSTGGNYVNFQLAEDLDERTIAAYGKNFERLRRVKGVYDPTNLFRSNRNISPWGPGEPRRDSAERHPRAR
ncbi:MAG: FAD-binding oxidoreductase [Deltaproteobacteria bacterium]|nr:FAD-binding oxidoreductase [Deltaproteobacteria bacterium]